MEIWQTFASFEITAQLMQGGEETQYQTVIRNLETNEEKSWPGLIEDDFQAWLKSHLAEFISTSEGTELSPGKIRPPSEPQISSLIEDLRIYQPPTSGVPMNLYHPSLMFPSPIRGDMPFALEVEFRITGYGINVITDQMITYQLESFARGLKREGTLSLGTVSSTPLSTDQETYTIRLPETTLPQGTYRLQILLTLQGTRTFPAFLEVPVVQVI